MQIVSLKTLSKLEIFPGRKGRGRKYVKNEEKSDISDKMYA